MLTTIRKFGTEKAEYIISVLIFAVPRFFMIYTHAYPLRVTGDELFLFWLPAKLAGLDWSGCMENYRYYGWGFNILLTPLFLVIDNPVVLYKIVLSIVVLVQCLIPIICIYILRRYFSSVDCKKNILITVICSYSVSLYSTYMYNEHIYIVFAWACIVVLLALLRNRESKKKQLILSAAFGLIVTYAMTIHARAVTLLIGFIGLYILWLILYRKRYGYLSLILAIYFIGNKINDEVVEWNNALLTNTATVENDMGHAVVQTVTKQTIANTKVNFRISKMQFTNPEYLAGFIKTIMGNLNAWNVYTYGFSIIAFLIGGLLIYEKAKRRLQQKESDISMDCIIAVGIFCFICVLVTIMGLGTSWGWGIAEAYVAKNNNSDALRGLAYVRYFNAYSPPVLLVILEFLCRRSNLYNKIFLPFFVLSVALNTFWIKSIVQPLLTTKPVGLGAADIFAFVDFNTKEITLSNYYAATLVLLNIILLIWIFYVRQKPAYVLWIICVLTVYRYTYNVYWGDGVAQQVNYAASDASTYLIQELKAEGWDGVVYANRQSIIWESYQAFYYQLQFMNMKSNVVAINPDKITDEEIYFALDKEPDKELIDKAYQYIKLDENESVYVKGTDLGEIILRIVETK